MGLQFLFPNWLWALSLIAIPIIIHLFNFRRYKLVYFTNVHLLKEVKKDSQAKTRLKEWLILLSRILLISALVLAFAQPVWVDIEKKKQYSNQSDLIIIVDNSFSMSAEGKEGIQLEKAKRSAIDILSAYPASTKVMMLSTDLSAQQLTYKSKEDSYTTLSQIKISPFTNSLNRVVKVAKDRADKNVPHHVYIISDFQKSDYIQEQKLDSLYSVFLLPLEAPKHKNVIIDTTYFHSPIHNLFENEQLIYSITNVGEDDIVDFGVELFINDSLKAIANIDIPSGESIIDTFNYKNGSHGLKKGKISISDFPIVFDNELHFNYSIKENLRVGVYSDQKSDAYLEAFFKNNTYYEVQYFDIHNVDMNFWRRSDVIIINTRSILSTGIQEQIQQHVEQKKSLLVFANENDKNLNLWKYLRLSFTSADTTSKHINSINTNSDLYKNSFSTIKDKMDLPIVENSMSITKFDEWLVKSKSGEVLVASQNSNNMNVLAFSIPMKEANRGFYTHPVFIPLMYNFMSDAQKQPAYYYSNQANTAYLQMDSRAADEVINIKRGEAIWIPEQYSVSSGVKVHMPTKLESGYYSYTYKEKEIGGFSFNYDRKESIQDFYSPEELQNNEQDKVEILNTNEISSSTIAEKISHTMSLWYYFILSALLFLVLEILLIKFWRK